MYDDYPRFGASWWANEITSREDSLGSRDLGELGVGIRRSLL